MHTARSSLPASLQMEQSLKRKIARHRIPVARIPGTRCPKEGEVVQPQAQSRLPRKGRKTGALPDLPAGSLALRTIPWDYVMDESINRTQIRLTYSGCKRKGI